MAEILFFMAVLIFIAGINRGFCFHSLIYGTGGIDCKKCGHQTYFFPLLWLYKILGRVEEI